jgi:predicted ATPase/DNA-binding CsgD family transcriptional regulator
MTRAVSSSRADEVRRCGQLPTEVTGFVGRAQELAQVTGLLARARLVTVVGSGGVGKTRVCLTAAARAARSYRDGVCLIELSGLRDPALLPYTVANALGLPEKDGRTQLDTVLDYLRGRQLLLILDTCEHLIDACATLAEAVLLEAPGVTLLATSRQPLDVPGEHTCLIPPLPVPTEDDRPVAATGGDAVELFAQRAAAVVPAFRVTDANRATVVRLCRRLDGIPLAIELAAVRLRALPLRELAARLDCRFQVLTGGRRGAVPRHQTLRMATEWSHDLCTPAEQALWARLSVFAGTFDVAAVEEVCTDAGTPRAETLQALVGLVDKSVVLREGADGSRYRLLDTLREFGAERLAASGRQEEYRSRHIARYRAMAQYFGEHFLDDDQTARFHELRREHSNIRAALEYALSGAEIQSGCRGRRERDGAELATALYGYWIASGRLREGRYWLSKVLERFPGASPQRAGALIVRGYLGAFQGESADAIADTREGIRTATEIGADDLSAQGYLYLSLALVFAGRHDDAVAAGAEAQRRLEALGHRTGLLILDMHMGHLHQLTGDFDRAAERYEQGLRLLGESSERWLQGRLHTVAGLAFFQQPGKEAECASAASRALRDKHELGDIVGTGYALELLGWLAANAGRHQRAAWLIGAAQPLWERAGSRLCNTAIMEEFHQRAVKRARDVLGDKHFDALHAQGSCHPLDFIVEQAVGDADTLRVIRRPDTAEDLTLGLTNREQQIAVLVTSGLSNREIADKLVISKRTVDAHVEHIFSKLGVSSRVQLTVLLKERLPLARGTAPAP